MVTWAGYQADFLFDKVPASNLSAPDPKYAVVDMSWVVESIPGNASSLIVLNGTVEEVYQQLNEANPDYTNLLDRYWASRPSMRSQDSMRSIESMDDRPDCGYCKVCNKRWECEYKATPSMLPQQVTNTNQQLVSDQCSTLSTA